MDGFDPRAGALGPRLPKLPRNIQSRTQGWMRDHASRITAVTGLAPAANPHVNITNQTGMANALADVAMTMIPPLPASAAGPGEWFMRQAAKQMGRFMARETLGLYVPEYQAGGKAPALYVVAENIEESAAELHVSPEALAHYVTFHEATHQWQFTAHPWLNGYMKTSSDAMGAMLNNVNPRDLLRGVMASGGDIMSAIPGIADLNATMSLVEGYADFMTEQLGISQDPELATVASAMAQRRQDRVNAPSRGAVQDLVGKLTGLDAKRRQYAEGKRFCEAVYAAGGNQLLNQVWTSAATLPNAAEMATPQRWVARMSEGGRGQAAA